jgi:hypothetical protein
MKKPAEPELTDEERASQKAVDAYQQHESTFGEMTGEFIKLDDLCVELGSKLAAQNAVASPQAYATGADSIILTRKRDTVRMNWNRKRELLAHEIEKTTYPTIHEFAEETMRRTAWLWKQRRLDFVTNQSSLDGLHIRNLAKTNHDAIRAEIDKCLKTKSELQSMTTHGLRAVNDRIARANEDWEGVSKRIQKLETKILTEGTFQEMRDSISRSSSDPNPESIDIRHEVQFRKY